MENRASEARGLWILASIIAGYYIVLYGSNPDEGNFDSVLIMVVLLLISLGLIVNSLPESEQDLDEYDRKSRNE